VLEIRLPVTYEIVESDVLLLKAVADQIGVAIENSRLRELRGKAVVEERERIANELHDGLSLILTAGSSLIRLYPKHPKEFKHGTDMLTPTITPLSIMIPLAIVYFVPY